jgi:hypothetical protein
MDEDKNKPQESTERQSEEEKAETKLEERLYEPIRVFLRNIFANYYIEKPQLERLISISRFSFPTYSFQSVLRSLVFVWSRFTVRTFSIYEICSANRTT